MEYIDDKSILILITVSAIFGLVMVSLILQVLNFIRIRRLICSIALREKRILDKLSRKDEG